MNLNVNGESRIRIRERTFAKNVILVLRWLILNPCASKLVFIWGLFAVSGYKRELLCYGPLDRPGMFKAI